MILPPDEKTRRGQPEDEAAGDPHHAEVPTYVAVERVADADGTPRGITRI